MPLEPLPCGCPAARQTMRRAGAYVLRRGTYLPSCRLGAHAHSEDRIILTLRGHLDSHDGRRQLPLHARRALYRPAGQPHHDRCLDEAVCLAILLPDGAPVRLDPFAIVDAELPAIAARLSNEIDATDGAADLVLEGLTAHLVGKLQMDSCGDTERAPRWLFQVKDRIHDEYARPPSLTELAAMVDRDPSYVATTFRRVYGRTLGEYARELRIWHARPIVEDPSVPLVEIAPRAGFSDQSHFSRLFRRRFGVSPGEYRRRLRRSR